MSRLKRRRVHALQQPPQAAVLQIKSSALNPHRNENIAVVSTRTQRLLNRGLLNSQVNLPENLLTRYGASIGNRAIRRLLQRRKVDDVNIPHIAAQFEPEAIFSEGWARSVGEQTPEDSAAEMPPPEKRRMIRQGSSGAEAAYAQERLNAHGAMPPLVVDGIFGPLTRKATVAYQQSHGLVPDAIIGPRTWASLDGPSKLGHSHRSGSGLGGGAAGVGSTVMHYETGTQVFNPPAPGTKMSHIRDQIKDKQDKKPLPDLGKTVRANGVKAGSDEALYLWNILLQRAERKFWGSEIDAVTRIGPPPKGGGSAPVGQVTVQIDGAGNATVSLIRRGAVSVPAGFSDVASAKAALIRNFGFSAVKNGSATWSLADLTKVHAALSRLSAAEKTALNGVDLVRESALVDRDGNPLAGEFRYASNLAQGATSVSRVQTLRLTDLAFAGDRLSFTGGAGGTAAASYHTILHEAAHAVETKALREAEFARLEAYAELNAKRRKVNNIVLVFNPENLSAVKKAEKYSPLEKKSGNSYLRSIDSATAAINKFSNCNDLSRLDTLETSAAGNIAKRDAARNALPAGHPALTDFARVSALQDDRFSAAKERATAFKAVKAAERAERAATGSIKQMSKRLQNFVDFVTRHRIPPLTDYAKRNWPNRPQEFYAEAFALWKNDPAFLELNAKALKEWFDAGNHLI